MLNDDSYPISWWNVFLSLLWINLVAPALAIILFVGFIIVSIASLGFGTILLLPLLYGMPLWVSIVAGYFGNGYLLTRHGVAYGRYGVFWGTLAASVHAWLFWAIWRNHVWPPVVAVDVMILYPVVGALVGLLTLWAMQKSNTLKTFIVIANTAIVGLGVYAIFKIS